MRKIILILSAFALGTSLSIASPTSDAVALNRAKTEIANAYNAKIRAANAIKDTAAVATLKAEQHEKNKEWNDANRDAIFALVPHIDEISANNPSAAAFTIRLVLSLRNQDDEGNTAKIFEQRPEDASLARKLIGMGNGSSDYVYYRHYGTAAELAALPGTTSDAIISSIGFRAKVLGVHNDIFPAYYEKCLGLGTVSSGYTSWFRQKVKETARRDKAAAIALLHQEQTALDARADARAPKIAGYIDGLRLHADKLAEMVGREN
jgi:hypothetical protein